MIGRCWGLGISCYFIQTNDSGQMCNEGSGRDDLRTEEMISELMRLSPTSVKTACEEMDSVLNDWSALSRLSSTFESNACTAHASLFSTDAE